MNRRNGLQVSCRSSFLHKLSGWRPLDRARTLWLLVLAWALAITWLSSLSGDSIHLPSVGELPVDKALHYAAYLVGGFLLGRAVQLSFQWGFWATLAGAVAALAVFGGLDEFHQTFVAGRSGADWGDWLANALGGGTGALIALKHHERDE